jgi:hypothetical protein
MKKFLDWFKCVFPFFIVIFTFYILLFSSSVIASDNQFITIVNPVRIAPYTKDSAKSILAEYKIIKDRNLPATWLLTYDVLENEKAINAVATFDRNQEIGLFLEVNSSLCLKAKVVCNEGSWHHANVIFLSGYTQEDRKKLIDTLFLEFKNIFGYYPKSVGSWWTDAYSLSYMQGTYGITANLTCSDQFSTDGYEIWGQYWMYPYMPSKYHAGMPATDSTDQLDIVTIQWAARDPLRGYESSLYSTQDYQTKPLDYSTDFFDRLVKTYAFKNRNSFGQMTVGLEGDFNPADYEGEYENQIQIVKQYVDQKIIEPVTMSSFSDWYRSNNVITAPMFIQSDKVDSLYGRSYWYQSSKYRLNTVYDSLTNKTFIRDLRIYHSGVFEPYYSSRNTYQKLTINIPSLFDEMNAKDNVWNLEMGKFLDISNGDKQTVIKFEDGSITLDPQSFMINEENIKVPQIIQNSKSISLSTSNNDVTIHPKDHWISASVDTTYYALSEIAQHDIARRRTKVFLISIVICFVILSFLIIKGQISVKKRIFYFVFIFLAFSVFPTIWYYKNINPYSVSQSEIDVLNHLSMMPRGNVLVYDHECLGCESGSVYKPAAYTNNRGYVSKYGKHPVIYNKDIFEEKDLEKAKQEFIQLKPQYIYLTRYEGFEEKMPFSPGDFNIEKIYESANGELWRVKD